MTDYEILKETGMSEHDIQKHLKDGTIIYTPQEIMKLRGDWDSEIILDIMEKVAAVLPYENASDSLYNGDIDIIKRGLKIYIIEYTL